MKILVIDDDEGIRQSLKLLLEPNGHEVLAAADGREGVKLAESRPDFIFCDVSMPPGLDGFAVLENIRQQPDGQLVPFVFLTGNADRADQRRGMGLGADDYITKPFSGKEILDSISARTRRRQPLQERIDELVDHRRREVGADWSHELLTPLNGMLGGLQLLELELETMSREELKEMIAIIRGGVERQEKLSRKLLRYFELERLKEGTRTPGSYRCQAEVVIAAGARRAVAGTPREADLEVRAEPGIVPIRESFVSDAIAELVDNALRFSTPGQRVTVLGRRQESSYHVEVVDEGPGMTAAERAAVAPFTQFGRKLREQQGLGLGLAIVRSITQVAGGKMSLEEGPGGRGLKVALVLPMV